MTTHPSIVEARPDTSMPGAPLRFALAPRVATMKVVRSTDGGHVVVSREEALPTHDVAPEVVARDSSVRVVRTEGYDPDIGG